MDLPSLSSPKMKANQPTYSMGECSYGVSHWLPSYWGFVLSCSPWHQEYAYSLPEKSSVSVGSDGERLNLQHVLSTFLCSTFHSLPPLTVCVSIVQAFSISSLQVQKYSEKPIIAAQFCQENNPAPNLLLMRKQDMVSSANLSALMHFVSGRQGVQQNRQTTNRFFPLENQLISQCKGWCSNCQW